MPSAPSTKASDKTQACKKLTALLQKDYGKSLPKIKLPVLETMLFAVCLEDNAWDQAEAGYEKLLKSYFDLNEIRVSSVGELERTLSDLKHSDWKGLRIRSILRFVFESTYTFDFEKLSRLTLESAQKRLKKIDYLSPFVANFTLQQILGSHVVCLDDSSRRAAIHLGIVPPASTVEEASEFLKAGVKKTEAFGFSCLLRCLATDPRFEARIADEFDEDEEFDVLLVAERLAALKAPKKKKKKKKKPAPEPAVTKKKAATKKKPAAKKPAAKKKPATKKKPAKKAAAKKQTTSTAAARKKTTTKKKPVKKAAAKKKNTKKKTSTTAARKKSTRKKSAGKKKKK